MIKGLFISRQYSETVWERDFKSSTVFNTEKYGIKIDVCKDYKNMFNHNFQKILNENYDFFMTEEVRLIKFRECVLDKLRENKKKVILISQEPFISDTISRQKAYFFHKKCLRGKEYLFVPDAVFVPGTVMDSWWKKYTTCRTYVTGYPRFDYCSVNYQRPSREEIIKKYNLAADKKIILFLSYPPYMYAEPQGGEPIGGLEPDIIAEAAKAKDNLVDLYSAHEQTIKAFETFVTKNSEYQVIIKVHPMAYKVFINKKKKFGSGVEISGTMLKYYENPTNSIKVIADEKNTGDVAKELLIVADIVTGHGSTMLLEAMMLNKPVIHILFGKTQKLHLHPEHEIWFPTAHTEKELFDIIPNVEARYIESLVERYFCKNDGKTCERICEAIKEELKHGTAPSGAILRSELIPKDIK